MPRAGHPRLPGNRRKLNGLETPGSGPPYIPPDLKEKPTIVGVGERVKNLTANEMRILAEKQKSEQALLDENNRLVAN